MRDIPIIFSAPMVRALLDGRKTQTRRILKPQPPRPEDFPGAVFGLSPAVADGIKMYSLNDHDRLPKHPTKWDLDGSVGRARDAGFPLTYNARYAVGDRLWVRETFFPRALGLDISRIMRPHYRADPESDRPEWKGLWRPSIHMPRWASRLTLVVTEVRVQRLQDISEADALAEGIGAFEAAFAADRRRRYDGDRVAVRFADAFADLWDSLHGAKPGEAWADNPWVVAPTFSVHRANIDALQQDANPAAQDAAPTEPAL